MLKSLKTIVFGLVAASLSMSAMAENERALDLDALLKQLEEGKFAQTQQNKQREQEFLAKRAEQDQILRDTNALRDNTLALSERLETQFEQNEFKLADLNEALTTRLGSLKELFGVLQQVAGDTKNKFYNSMISAEISGRSEFLDQLAQDMGSSSKLASIEEIERVWFELQREMTESGKVTKFTTDVVEAGGAKVSKEVVRVGPFALVADGKYLEFNGVTGTVSELIRQPADRYGESAAELQASNGDIVKFGIDPTGGSILGLLVQAPNLQERVEQGGVVGYIILIVGAFGLLLSIERLFTLTVIRAKVNSQLKSAEVKDNNPLGRVLKVRDEHPNADTEALELHLTEAILAEVPKLGRNLTIIKIISVVAPLMGLLGTVTGMINTFQAITLFGTGDPKLMAGGISTALVTTVLGLVVAIPTTLLYAMLNTRSKNIVYILQEQAAGVIAERAERG
ncbi:MAG: MotA/TolQ/ExbB proton channel family protein [Aestuariibacter sp.]|jgi:biopolymer transport protein ExbB|nr:MotA/TolQ/ExbB proton channel family protein [Marisediminitalea aggregata]MCP3861763.1 MotA/TolQ/ExbB proton channel family protein [Aestuariibacter sp.]MCP4525939.1 MotA/TolQ/ExbB proton channel family protein [Aestuariibacter sp.]MCP4946420.1 MotA/TolQ/ExbB proton channel family protein [Aestuariibacter sp.]MCP9476629.1 MotA/TolQ/ExbB proton channel family protein [Marisediminitalea aggregata]|tara:strand:+ start:1203 stop:2567 length:1365 start_codon:yes stop_codon:yes gene_type:complete